MERRSLFLVVLSMGCGAQRDPVADGMRLAAPPPLATLTVVSSGLTLEGRASLSSVVPEEGATCAPLHSVWFEALDGTARVQARAGLGRFELPSTTDGAEATSSGRFLWPDGSQGSPGDGFVEMERVGDEMHVRVETSTRCFEEELEPGLWQMRCEADPLSETYRILVVGSSLDCPRGSFDAHANGLHEGLCSQGGWCLGSPPSWLGEEQD